MDVDDIQRALVEQELDGWLFADHHGRDHVACRVLDRPSLADTTRHWYYLIPSDGEPRGLVSTVEPEVLDGLPGTRHLYRGWRSQRDGVRDLLDGCRIVAMQYSPDAAFPGISLVDCGTVEAVRTAGVVVATSASLVLAFDARLTATQIATHFDAGRKIDAIRRAVFNRITDALRSGRVETEWSIVSFVRTAMEREGLRTSAGPLIAVDEHLAFPHYQSSPLHDAAIASGSLVLVDIWGKTTDRDAVYYDTAWMGYGGAAPPPAYDMLFDLVVRARDEALMFLSDGIAAGRTLRGCEIDGVAREVIRRAHYEDAFVHRLGHSIGRDVHGSGVNLDSLEVHDDRQLLPDTVYALEPGIYLPDCGVRTEFNVLVTNNSATVTGEVQHALLRLS